MVWVIFQCGNLCATLSFPLFCCWAFRWLSCSGYCERVSVFLSVCVPYLFFPKSRVHCQYGWVWAVSRGGIYHTWNCHSPLSLRSCWWNWPVRPNPFSSMVALSRGTSTSPLVLPSIDCPYLALFFLSPVSSFIFFKQTKEVVFINS